MGKLLSWLFALALVAGACGDRTVPAGGGTPGATPAGGGAKPGGATPAPSPYDYQGY